MSLHLQPKNQIKSVAGNLSWFRSDGGNRRFGSALRFYAPSRRRPRRRRCRQLQAPFHFPQCRCARQCRKFFFSLQYQSINHGTWHTLSIHICYLLCWIGSVTIAVVDWIRVLENLLPWIASLDILFWYFLFSLIFFSFLFNLYLLTKSVWNCSQLVRMVLPGLPLALNWIETPL